ncbi:MAG TPA: hypothetical protein VNL39_04955 [Xanthobacteraceae bacterium]|nr:hypothetical protein [Xanthobacteraceae bacterium]
MNYYAIPERTGAGSRAVSGDGSSGLRIPFALVFAALTFNFFLCFVHTNFFAVSRAHVVAAEALIIGLTYVAAYKSIGHSAMAVICGVVSYLLIVSLFRSLNTAAEFDVKTVRDFMIPVAFFLLGTTSRNLIKVDSMVRIAAVIVTAVAVFEYFFLDTYLRFFNIIEYYVSRGSVDREEIDWLSVNLFVSGIRPEGRTLFPFLGDHRVSSIFLEPVSPGNFSVTLFFWALVRSYFEKRLYLGLFVMAIFLTIMADNRFGAFMAVVALGMVLLPNQFLRMSMFWLPFVAIFCLIGIGLANPDTPYDNSLWGRLLSSGQTLVSLNIWNWFGVGPTIEDWDSGYTYSISRIGIIGFVAFWGIFMTLRSASAQFHMFRAFCALYFAAILCVSYSPYTIKTAGLLWFLLGALFVAGSAVQTPVVAVPASRLAVRQDLETISSR